MPILLLLLISVLAGLGAALLTRRYPGRASAPAVIEVAREAGEHATGAAAQRAARAARLDPEKATGLALTLALLVILVGGVVLALLAIVVRSTDVLAGIDSSVAEWGHRHGSAAWSRDALTLVTRLGEAWVVVPVAILVAGVELARTRSRWVVPFLLAVILGDKLLTAGVKELVDRARPEIEAVAATLGPSFPSGHTSTAAASWAAFALVAGRWWGRPSWPALAGAAVGIAVAVALSRVFLDVHWLTDVLGGLALGWAWFAACAIAFGGRLLSFGASAQAAGRGAAEAASAEPPEAASRSRS
jgi:membrane-associated phospholipid phosphatase